MNGPAIALLAATMSALASAALVGIVRQLLLRRNILDRPNERSSHTVPTPRGAGVALVPVMLLAWIAQDALLPAAAGHGAAAAWVVPLAALALAAVSWLDDLHSLGALPRLAAQVAGVFAAVYLLPGPVFQGLLPPALDGLLAAIGWIWFVNLFNFMDGIDGISGVEAAAIGLGIALIGLFAAPGFTAEHGQALALAAAAAGFLVWNWHPAKIFLGDTGSVALGYLLGWLLLVLAASGPWQAALILPLYYLADASLTLFRRLTKGEKIWRAHRSHFYQRAVQHGRSHGTVSLAVAGTNLVLVALGVFAASAGPASLAAWLTLPVAGFAVLALLAWMGFSGRPRSGTPA